MASYREKQTLQGQKKSKGSWGILHGYSWRCVCCQDFRFNYRLRSLDPSHDPPNPCRRNSSATLRRQAHSPTVQVQQLSPHEKLRNPVQTVSGFPAVLIFFTLRNPFKLFCPTKRRRSRRDTEYQNRTGQQEQTWK